MNRALLIGINKYPSAPLRGCVNDITDMAAFLMVRCGFKKSDIRLLCDTRATTKAILERLEWLVTGIKAGDRVVFHYSGHGVQLPTRNPAGEIDGLDEAICPVDFDWSEQHTIRDKEFNRIFRKVPEGVPFVWISDSCHSGDLLKLMRKPSFTVKTISPPPDIDWRFQTAAESNIEVKGFRSVAQELNLALITGCKSNQTSADAVFKKRPNGALTYFLLSELKTPQGLKRTLVKVVKNVNTALKRKGFNQQPQLEGKEEMRRKPFLGD
jgi:hypothetical protein